MRPSDTKQIVYEALRTGYPRASETASGKDRPSLELLVYEVLALLSILRRTGGPHHAPRILLVQSQSLHKFAHQLCLKLSRVRRELLGTLHV